MEFLGNWVLDFDGFDSFIQRRQTIQPSQPVRTRPWNAIEGRINELPFLRRYDLDDARLHAILVDFRNECFEAAELAHCL